MLVRDKKFKVAAVQAAPIYLDREATTNKQCALVEEAAKNGAELIVFPECFNAMYPNWPTTFPTFIKYWNRFADTASEIPGPVTDALGKVARETHTYIVTGLVEADPNYQGTIYNSSVFIGPKGEIVGRHRKITPPLQEMFYFKFGNSDDVKVFDTELGMIGIGICFEHFDSLFRRALSVLGEQVHCALWVTWPGAEHWIDCSAKSQAIENRIYVVVAAQVEPANVEELEKKTGVKQSIKFVGGSGILSPGGKYLAGPLYNEEGILYADIDIAKITQYRAECNKLGKDSRDDLFTLIIKKKGHIPYSFQE